MKKGIFTIGFLAMLFYFNPLIAQDDSSTVETTEQVIEADSMISQDNAEMEEEVADPVAEEVEAVNEEVAEDDTTVSQALKLKFIEGGPLFMSFVLIALILGLALSIERIIYLNLATTNSKKLVTDIESALSNGGVDAAKEVCRNTRGPVASIFLQGLERSGEGVNG
jgi:biopolymer transport protein ExbB